MPNSMRDHDVVAMVRGRSSCPTQDVSLESEIFYDLNIYGEEFYELIADLESRFSVDLSSLIASNYVPGEGFGLGYLSYRLFGIRRFRSIKVSDLCLAVKRGGWRVGD